MNLRLIIGFCVSLILHMALLVGVFVLFKEDDRMAKLSTHTKTVVLAMNVVQPTPNAPAVPIASVPKPPAPIEKPPEKPAEKKPEPPKEPKKAKKPKEPKRPKKPKKPKPKKKVVKKKPSPKKPVTPKPVEPPPVERVDPPPVVTAPPVATPSAPTSSGATATSAPYSPNPVPPGAIVGTKPQTAGVRSLKGTVTYRFVMGRSSVSDQSGTQRLNCGGRKPAYPKKAQRRNIEGAVNIAFTADDTGRIIKASIRKASHPFLNDRKILKFLHRHCQVPS